MQSWGTKRECDRSNLVDPWVRCRSNAGGRFFRSFLGETFLQIDQTIGRLCVVLDGAGREASWLAR
jgi:hypothetical protein